MKTLHELVEDTIISGSREELRELLNKVSRDEKMPDKFIYKMEELDEVLGRFSPSTILYFYRDLSFNSNDTYFQLRGDRLVSSDDFLDLYDLDYAIDYIVKTEKTFDIDPLKNIFKNYHRFIERAKRHLYVIGGQRERLILTNIDTIFHLKNNVLEFYGNGKKCIYDYRKKEVIG